MKNLLVKTILSLFVIASLAIGCNTPAEKVVKAQQNVDKANQALDKANVDYMVDVENYRKNTQETIDANNRSIAEFKVRVENEKKEARVDYQKRIAELEQKNSDMKRKLDEYKVDGKEKWETFKTEFGRDMDNLGRSFKDFTVSNKK